MVSGASRRAKAERQTHGQRSAEDVDVPMGSGGFEHMSYDGSRDMSETHSRSQSQSSPSQIAGSTVVAVRAKTKNLNLDLGASGATLMANGTLLNFPARPAKLNSTGREITVKLNAFKIAQAPTKPVYQYDVLIGNGAEKRKLIEKVWKSDTVQKKLGRGWVFDGNQLAWSLAKNEGELRLLVDLDAEQGRQKRPNPDGTTKEDRMRIVVRLTKQVNFTSLVAYLAGQASFDNSCLEAINFLDHLLRETPKSKYIAVRRNFFPRNATKANLGGGLEAFRGVYMSTRLTHSANAGSGGMSIIVHVANSAFWTPGTVAQAAMNACNARDFAQLSTLLKNSATNLSTRRGLDKLRRVAFYTLYQLKTGESKDMAKDRPHIINKIVPKSANEMMLLDFETSGQRFSVAQYFQKKYGIRLQFPDLPLIESTRKFKGNPIYLPMELCYISDAQRFAGKLSDRQTTEMLKFAATEPRTRWQHIEEGLGMLNWGADHYLTHFGVKVSTTPTIVKARLLPSPKVLFGEGSRGGPADPGTSGRWDLRGKTFKIPFQQALSSWGVGIYPGFRQVIEPEAVKNFIRQFVSVMERMGCPIAAKEPVILTCKGSAGEAAEQIYNATGHRFNKRPQIIFLVVPDKNVDVYERFKKSADCRYGIVSQVMQASHVMKANDQYMANVGMKVNAKLGGVTQEAQSPTAKPPGGWFKVPTMIIGADVTHGGPRSLGERDPSIAAITMSWDRVGVKYRAGVQTNGYSVEMITPSNWQSVMAPMARDWAHANNKGIVPKQVIYIRDGVSEGQFAQVLEQEVSEMNKVFTAMNPAAARDVKYLVIVGTKRHHLRIFPDQSSGDRKSNPHPGTLVETGATHPFEFDFLLCAHSAIKGTAKPVHYHVLRNDANYGAVEIQNMLYEGSYQFVRSTTPISLYPAAYYAHLAAARAKAHLPFQQSDTASSTTPLLEDAPELLKMATTPEQDIHSRMWFV